MNRDQSSSHHQVLLVEDDPLIARTLTMSLPYKGFEVISCDTLQKGLEVFRTRPFDIVLLDINLPDGNGLDLCKQIRTIDKTVPIVMLTAKVDESSAVTGFEKGADDYIRKPYGPQELVARMSRLLEAKKGLQNTLNFDCLSIDPRKRIASAGEVQLSLGKREFEILLLLIKKSGDVVTRNDILNTLGENVEVYDRTIDSHLSHLRRKIKETGVNHILIAPIYGIGYRLEIK